MKLNSLHIQDKESPQRCNYFWYKHQVDYTKLICEASIFSLSPLSFCHGYTMDPCVLSGRGHKVESNLLPLISGGEIIWTKICWIGASLARVTSDLFSFVFLLKEIP